VCVSERETEEIWGEWDITRRKLSIYHGQKSWLKGRFSWLMTL
jgi:hypothetical protein